jgi:hypothetical protein
MKNLLIYATFLFLLGGCDKDKKIPLPELGEYEEIWLHATYYYANNPDSTWTNENMGGGRYIYFFYNDRDVQLPNFNSKYPSCDSTKLKICHIACNTSSCYCRPESSLCLTEVSDDSISFHHPFPPSQGIVSLKIGYNKKTKTYEGWEEGRGLERVGQVGQYRMYVWKARVTLKKVE